MARCLMARCLDSVKSQHNVNLFFLSSFDMLRYGIEPFHSYLVLYCEIKHKRCDCILEIVMRQVSAGSVQVTWDRGGGGLKVELGKKNVLILLDHVD